MTLHDITWPILLYAISFVLCLGKEAETTRHTQWVGVGLSVSARDWQLYEVLLDRWQTTESLLGCIFYSFEIG